MISGDPLTGRENELAVIRRALGGAGNHSGAVIVGAAGVGKTRLAREVLARAEASGARTHWIVGTQSAKQLPLGAFASVCETISDPVSDVRRIINSFGAQQQQRRSLIGIDDAHLLDTLSAHVVHQLAQARSARLVVTVRIGGDEPDAITALWKDDLLTRLDLQPLSASDVRRTVETTLGGVVDSRSAKRFWKLTGGNMLFLRQLLKDQIDAGAIRQLAGVWIWDERVAVSDSLGDIVDRQLGRLAPGVALVVDTLSQYEPLTVDVLCDLVDRHDLETAEQTNLVTVERSGVDLMARLAHPLFGELRRATASEMYLSRIRGKLAQRLAKDADADMRATVRRALLTLESDLAPEPQLFLESARFAMTLLDLDLSDRFATAAADAGVSEAVGLRAISLAGRGHGKAAEAILAGIGVNDPDGHHWATVRAANLIWNLGQPMQASAILADLASTRENAAERAERAAIESCVDAVMASCETAVEKAQVALRSPTLPDYHAMLASIALTIAQGALGKIDDITGLVAQAIDRAITSFQASPMRFWYGAVYARACRLNGRIDECVRSATQLSESARDVPGLAYANLAFLLGYAQLVRGEIPDAVNLLHEALAGAEKHSVTTGLRAASCFALAEAHAKLGQPDAANDAVTEARKHVPADYLFMQTGLAVARGWALAANGRLTDAISVVRAAGDDARKRNQATHELVCLQVAAQWGETSGEQRAAELASELSLPLADAVARHTKSLRADDGEGLLAASADYRALGDPAVAADVAAQAAVAFSRHQQRKRSLNAAALAQQLASDCGGLCTPALRHRIGIGEPLTDRQREIIELAAAGLSNKEIAERLVTSVRTVEGHLYRAYQRLGAGSREELIEILRASPAGS